MMKIDATVRRESIYVAGWIVLLSVLMQAVFIIIGKWDYTVLCGNLLGGAASFANFLLLGITVQKAVAMEEKQAANAMKLSQTLRLLMIFIAADVQHFGNVNAKIVMRGLCFVNIIIISIQR